MTHKPRVAGTQPYAALRAALRALAWICAPGGEVAAYLEHAKAEAAAKKAASRGKKRGSNMSLAEAQRTGYKTFVSLKGDATQKEAKKGWLNPFSDE